MNTNSLLDEVDFSQGHTNPYAKFFNSPVTLDVNTNIVQYLEEQSNDTGIPLPTLINLVLADYMHSGKKITVK